MNGQDLKNSILQLAIQGKLVEQRQEEGTAKELLEQIRAEKQRLVNGGKIKREKPLPEILEDEMPFDIPEGWEWVALRDVLTKITDGTHNSPANFESGQYMYVTAKNIKESGVDLSNITYVAADIHQKIYDRCNPEFGDVLLIKDGATTGIVTVNNIQEQFSLLSSVALLKVPAFICAWYIVYALRSDLFYRNIRKQMKGTGITRITLKQIESLHLPLPPLEEQKRIVAKIEELMPYVNQYDDAYAKVEELNKKFPEEMQKSILQYAIKGKLVEQRQDEGTAEDLYQQIQAEKARLVKEGKIKREKPLPAITEDEIPFDIPESWKWVRLGEIGMTNIGLTYKPTDITNEGTIVLRSSNIQDGQLDYNDLVKVSCTIPDNKMCQTGDILICARNGSKRLVGKAAMIDKGGMSFGAFMAIYRSVCNEYILYIINSAYFRNSMLPETGTTTINQITQETLRHCIIPLPPLKEQKRIVAKIEELMPYTKQLVK